MRTGPETVCLIDIIENMKEADSKCRSKMLRSAICVYHKLCLQCLHNLRNSSLEKCPVATKLSLDILNTNLRFSWLCLSVKFCHSSPQAFWGTLYCRTEGHTKKLGFQKPYEYFGLTSSPFTIEFLYKYTYVLLGEKNVSRLNLIFKSVVTDTCSDIYVLLHQFPR